VGARPPAFFHPSFRVCSPDIVRLSFSFITVTVIKTYSTASSVQVIYYNYNIGTALQRLNIITIVYNIRSNVEQQRT